MSSTKLIEELEQATASELVDNDLLMTSVRNSNGRYTSKKMTLGVLANYVNNTIEPVYVNQINGIISQNDNDHILRIKTIDGLLCAGIYSNAGSEWRQFVPLGEIKNCVINCSDIDEEDFGQEANSCKIDNCIININEEYYIQYLNDDAAKITIFREVPTSGLIIPASLFTNLTINTKHGQATSDGNTWTITSDQSWVKTEFESNVPGTYSFVLKAGTYDYVAIGSGGKVCGRKLDNGLISHAATGDSADVVVGWFSIATDSIVTASVAEGLVSEFTLYNKGNSSSSGRFHTYLEINGTKYIDAPEAGGYLISGERPTDSGYSFYRASHATTYREENKAVETVISGKNGYYSYSTINSSSSVPATAYANAEYPYGGSNGFKGNAPHSMVQRTMNNNGYLKLTKRAD